MSNIQIKQLSGSMGAEIIGLDLSKDLNNYEWEIVYNAFIKYIAIFFPDQNLDPKSYSSFFSRFGKPLKHPFIKSIKGSKYIHEIIKKNNEENVFGNVWHTDFTNLIKPSLANALYAKKTPEYGGDTLFSNMYLVYESFSTNMQNFLKSLEAFHGFSDRYKKVISGKKNNLGLESDLISYKNKFNKEVIHPVVRTHPISGKKCIYVNPNFTLRIKGLNSDESEVILKYLYNTSIMPDFTFRYKWSNNTLGIWDNRCSMHYAVNDYGNKLRVMQRMVVMEDTYPKL